MLFALLAPLVCPPVGTAARPICLMFFKGNKRQSVGVPRRRSPDLISGGRYGKPPERPWSNEEAPGGSTETILIGFV